MGSGWSNSDRRNRLPPDWTKRRKLALKRDGGKCQADSERRPGRPCGREATEVDHVRPGDDHSLANLQSLCAWHHGRKTALEGNAARRAAQAQRAARFRKPEERHPGLL